MKRLVLVFVLALFTSLAASAANHVKLMTRNVYLGADLGPVIAAPTPEEFLARAQFALGQVAANQFPERAEALAREIHRTRPHIVALQEVFDFTLNGANGAPPFRDYLADLLAAIGSRYEVAAINDNFAVELPIPALGVVGILDRDVILARRDVPTSVVPVQLTGCLPSVDGCTYGIIAEADTAIGLIQRKRGFAVVDAWIGGEPYRVANTHLELRLPDPSEPLSPAIQAAQAAELLARLASLPNPDEAPVVIAGDLNSKPSDKTLVFGPLTIVPPYQQAIASGFADLWVIGAAWHRGFTCCHAPDLSNPLPRLEERIDFLLIDQIPERVRVRRVGHRLRDRTPSGLWPSDHAGVVAKARSEDGFDEESR